MAEAHETPRPQAPPLAVGAVVGDRYRIIKEIGGGGMGFVFEAEHIALERRFALKVLRVGHWDEELVRRFEREARALGKISSPRVAQVSDFGVADGVGPYYIMELVPGLSLQQRLDESALAPRDAVEMAIGLCDALVDVHAQGIVHRDLKPANIGIPGGAIPVKLLDFGLAASIDDAFFTRITQSQQVLGSMPYISPEQFAGARPSVRQDIWAIGVVFYEMLTGSLPFEAPSTPALMHRILTAPPALIGDVPIALGRALDKLLHKDPEQRVKSASEAGDLLRGIDLDSLPEELDCPSREIGTAPTSTGSGVRLTTGSLYAPPPPASSTKIALGILAASFLIAGLGAWVIFGSDEGVPVQATPSAEAATSAGEEEQRTEDNSGLEPEETSPEQAQAPEETPPEETPLPEETSDGAPEAEAEAEVQDDRPRVRRPRRTPLTMRSETTMDLPPPDVREIQVTMEAPTPAMNAAMGTWTGEIIE
ncbi:MAG: serine/threonine-protein kinase [Polyangiales bacterium]